MPHVSCGGDGRSIGLCSDTDVSNGIVGSKDNSEALSVGGYTERPIQRPVRQPFHELNNLPYHQEPIPNPNQLRQSDSPCPYQFQVGC